MKSKDVEQDFLFANRILSEYKNRIIKIKDYVKGDDNFGYMLFNNIYEDKK